MTQYFIRFIEKPEYAESDLERGYSFREYQIFDTREECENHDWVEQGWIDVDLIAQHSNGQWGFALPGLCGFGPYESAEEAKEDAPRHHYSDLLDYCAVYTGRYVSDPAVQDGDCFVPHTLIEVFER